MFKVVRRIARICIYIVIFVALLFLGLTYYFRHATHFHDKLMSQIEQKVKAHHIRPLKYAQIPPTYRQAVIATEDRRFWWDPGIDPEGIARSIVVDVEKDGYLEGGSTITQQLVDNTMVKRKRSLAYKLKQMFYAIGIYDTVGKKQTFAMYANMIYFGQGAYGLYNAAETYFGKGPKNLNAGELTMLAGIPNAPSMYNPVHHYNLARQRQHIVLENMVDDGLVSRKQASNIFQMSIRLKNKK